MTIKNNIDPFRVGEEIFYNIFHHIFNDEGARKHFEFSQINFFNSTEGLPGWNLWFQENTMAYQLVLVDARQVFDHNRFFQGPSIEGRFAVRYFPGSDDLALDNYSCTETLLRLGSLFDNTGTPTLTGQESMDDSCFVVGYLDFRTDAKRNFFELECIAPNRWKDVRINGLYLNTPENEEYEMVAPGGIDRNVPGWDCAFYLFNKLILGCCHANKTMPLAVISAEKKWTRFDIDKDNNCMEMMDPDVDLFHMVTGFEIKPGHLVPMSQETYIQTVSSRLTSEGFLLSHVCKRPDSIASIKINPEWWSIKNKKFTVDIDFEMHHCCYHDH